MVSRLVLTLAIVLVGACSSASPGPVTPTASGPGPSIPVSPAPSSPPPTTTPTPASSAIRYECALVTRDEIEAITGRVVIDAHVNPSLTEPNCVWQFEPRPAEPTTNLALPQVVLMAWEPRFDAEVFATYSHGQVPVTGVGDGAYWHSVCRWIEDVGPNGCRLVFLLGETMYSVDSGRLSDAALSEGDGEVRAQAVEIAQAAIPRL